MICRMIALALGATIVAASVAHAQLTSRDRETLQNMLVELVDASLIACPGDRMALGYVLPGGQRGYREIRLADESGFHIREEEVSAADLANGIDARAVVRFDGALVRDFDPTGQRTHGVRGTWTAWRALSPLAQIRAARQNGRWLAQDNWRRHLEGVEGTGASLIRIECGELALADAGAAPQQCQSASMLYDMAGGQCTNGRTCWIRDRSSGREVNRCKAGVIDPTTGVARAEDAPRCPCF